MKRILLTGGGTGGHVYPLLAVAECLAGHECRYFGPAHDQWRSVVHDAGIPISHIAGAKLRRYFSMKNILEGPIFVWSVLQALAKVAWFRPHAAFSKGGPGALPTVIACRLYGVPVIIHESDSVPGRASRITGTWARIVELGWKEAAKYFPDKETHAVGVPIRRALLDERTMERTAALAAFGMDSGLPVLLVIGGSQGSGRLNAQVLRTLPKLLETHRILHQVGAANWGMHMAAYEDMKKTLPESAVARYLPFAYLDEKMGAAYRAADCTVSRAGSAIFELAAFGVPAVLVPLPESAHDHQLTNARIYAATGAAGVLEEKEMTDARFIDAIRGMTGNAAAHEAATEFAKPDAARAIATDILKIAA